MNLTVKARAKSYETLQYALATEAERFYGDRRFVFNNVRVTTEGDFFEAEADAYDYIQRPSKADVPDEKWDPFRNQLDYGPW